jgi:hypothetical protein
VRAAIVALVLAAALPAAAQSPVLTVKESPRVGSFQVTLSPFSPNIDSEFTNALYPPYATIFGTGRPLMVQGQFNMSAWIGQFGTLDIGVGAGFWEAWGQGWYQGSDGTLLRGGTTSLMIIPLQIQAGYRFEWFYERFSVPLEPYAKFAIVDYIWSTSGQSGVSSWTSPGGVAYRGSGATFGWSATLGMALVLDFFDTGLSRQMDYDVGINRTLLVVDFTKSSVNDFGSKNSWQLAPSYWAWSIGLQFVF